MEENRPWKAGWIWPDDKAAKKDNIRQERAYFRRVFDVPKGGGPAKLSVDVSADSRYRLYLNGHLVSIGPCKGNGWNHYYETVDASWALQPGRNVLAAVVVHYPLDAANETAERGPASIWRSGSGGFLLEGALIAGDGAEPVRLNTDGGWRAKLDGAVRIRKETFTLFAGGTEEVDGAKLPRGWRLPGFDDSAWSAPGTVTKPYDPYWGGLRPWQLTPSPLPPMRLTCEPFRRLMRGELAGRPLGVRRLDGAEELRSTDEGASGARELRSTDEEASGARELRSTGEGASGAEELRSTGEGAPGAEKLRLTDKGAPGAEELRSTDEGASGAGNARWKAAVPSAVGTGGSVIVGCADASLFPFHVEADAEGWVELDLGAISAGFPTLEIAGGTGARIALLYSEAYEKSEERNGRLVRIKGVRDDYAGKELAGNEDVFYPEGSGTPGCPETYEPLAVRAGRFVRLSVAAGGEPVTIVSLIWTRSGYPLNATAQAASSDPLWPAMWRISLNTLQSCMHDTYEDTPYYEQMGYTMDARLQALFTYQISGDDRLARKVIHDFHGSLLPNGMLQSRYPSVDPQIIPGFSLFWIEMLHEHYRHFGDKTFVRRYRATADAVLEWFDRRIEDGLVGTIPEAYWAFVDWVEEWRDYAGAPPAKWRGPMTIYNLMYATALDKAAELNEATGRRDTGAEYRERAEKIRRAARARCYDEAAGLFRDGPKTPQFSQHAQIWAVLCGAVRGPDATALMNRTLDTPGLAQSSFAMSHFLFRALSIAGLYERSVELWPAWRDQIGLNLTAWIEDPVQQRSDCHGWGALPLYEYTAETLGVRPEEPGFARILVAPQPSGLEWAKGTVETPRGPVRVAWEKQANGSLAVKVDGPHNVPAVLTLRDGRRFEAAACQFDVR